MLTEAGRDFVNDLRNKMSNIKIRKEIIKNSISEFTDYIFPIFKNYKDLSVGNLSKFENRDLCFFLDIVYPYDLIYLFSNIFSDHSIENEFKILSENKFVFKIDMGKKLISSPYTRNIFFLEVYSKRGESYKIRISNLNSEIKHYVYDKNYHEFKLWGFDSDKFISYDIKMGNINREKNKSRIQTPDGKYSMVLNFNKIGEINSLKLFKK